MELSDAEAQMIELLQYNKHFTLTINQDGALWHVHLEDHDLAKTGDGHGPTFDQAWDDVTWAPLKK